MSVHVWRETGLGWESCVSPGQNCPPKLTEAAEICVHGNCSRDSTAPGCTQGRAHGSSGEAQPTALKVTQLRATTYLQCHISKEPHTPSESQAPLPSSPDGLLPCCDGGTALHLITSSPWVLSRVRLPLVLTPSSAAGAEGCGAHPTTILCATAATLLRCLKARSKSHFPKNITFSLCANSHHPILRDCSPPRGQQCTKGTLEWQTWHCVTLGQHLKTA